MQTVNVTRNGPKRLSREIYKHRYYLLFLLPAIAYFVIFKYIPIYGITLAFKEFNFKLGILNSPWVGLNYFERLFDSKRFWEVFVNTIAISGLKLLFGFPAPIILAILMNEIGSLKFKKFVQTISYLPHFLSWVVLASFIIELLSPSRGVINYIITLFGGKPIYFLTESQMFRGIIVLTYIWQSVGWGTIIYLAAISGIEMTQFEAAYIDGANRFQIIGRIILPAILPVISIVFILGLGRILDAGFDQIFNLYNPMVYSTGDIIDTYVYRIGLIDMEYSLSTAVGLFKNIIGLFLVLLTNFLVRRLNDGENALW